MSTVFLAFLVIAVFLVIYQTRTAVTNKKANMKSGVALKYLLPSIYVILLVFNWPQLIWTVPVAVFLVSMVL